MAKYNVHGGHNPSGKVACGAKGLLDESKEDRKIAKAIIKYLKKGGATVYDCTVENGKSQSDVLVKICAKCNAHSVKQDYSVHLNSGRNDKKGDKKVGGFEIWAYSWDAFKKAVANRCRKKMKALGFTDRGLKTSKSLYYLKHTKAPAMLFEICFVDDKDDYLLYKSVGAEKIGKALAEAILNQTIGTSTASKVANKIKAKAKYTTVKKTSSKTAIKWMQMKLNTCYTGKLSKLAIDGIWGSKTNTMLKAYWKQLGWKTTGTYCGKKTCKALYANRKK